MNRLTLAIALLLVSATLQAQTKAASPPDKAPDRAAACDEKKSPGCGMMSAEEMKAHHEKMHSFKDRSECSTYMKEHHKHMMKRAEEKKAGPIGEETGMACDQLKKAAPKK